MKKPPIELVEATADAIKDHFIPKDPSAQQMVFNFTIPPSSNYRATYQKDHKGDWKLLGCEDEAGKK